MDATAELLSRRVEKVLPTKAELLKVMSSKRIRVYQGFDPTASKLHLGHAIGLYKLMDFARAGHEVIILFGTGTVLAGDPSHRIQARAKTLLESSETAAQEVINENIKDWQHQVSKIIDFQNPNVSIRQNGDWLLSLNLKRILEIASNISAVQLFKRESFQRRLEAGDTVWFHETMYPLLQGYDSVVMDVDLEIGGTDQEFNMLVGRELQHKMNNREKYVLTVPMIMGTDGKPMSKTSGNCIWLSDIADDMFGKLMKLPDDQIVPYLKLVTNVPLDRVKEIEEGITGQQLHPMEAKKELARAIITQFHGNDAALSAQANFEALFQKKGEVQSIPEISLVNKSLSLLQLLEEAALGGSNSDRKRLIREGAVSINDAKITDPTVLLDLKAGDIIKYGKHTFVKIK